MKQASVNFHVFRCSTPAPQWNHIALGTGASECTDKLSLKGQGQGTKLGRTGKISGTILRLIWGEPRYKLAQNDSFLFPTNQCFNFHPDLKSAGRDGGDLITEQIQTRQATKSRKASFLQPETRETNYSRIMKNSSLVADPEFPRGGCDYRKGQTPTYYCGQFSREN